MTSIPDPREADISRQLRDLTERTLDRSGITKAKVALLTGYTTQHLHKVFSGQLTGYSVDVLNKLARALAMTPSERSYLHSLANAAAELTLSRLNDSNIDLMLAEMERTPNPGIFMDLDMTVVRVNRAALEWLPHLAEGERNLMRWIFTSPGAREQLVDWEQWARLFWGEFQLRWDENGDEHSALNQVYWDLREIGDRLDSKAISGLHGQRLALIPPGKTEPRTIEILGLRPSTRPQSQVEAMIWIIVGAPAPTSKLNALPLGGREDIRLKAAQPDRDLANGPWRRSGGGRIVSSSDRPRPKR